MTKKLKTTAIIGITIILAGAGIFLLWFFVLSDNTEETTITGEQESIAGVDYLVPEGWTEDDLADRNLTKYMDARIRKGDDQDRITFQIQTLETKEKANFEDLKTSLPKKFRKQFDAFTKIAINDTEIDGLAGIKMEYTYDRLKDSKEEHIIRQEQIITQKGNTVYYLLSSAPDEDYEEVRAEFDAIFASIDFKDEE
ncbi:hypothetical protein ACFL2D_00340 [Patescibacteria group bacterium]